MIYIQPLNTRSGCYLNVQPLSQCPELLHVKLLLIGPLSVGVQRVDQPLGHAALTHPRAQLGALEVQTAQPVRVGIC